MRPLELYIHIPFCISKCKYCDFLSAPAAFAERKTYVTGLCRSIRSYGELAEAYQVTTVFVGGGTPSILEPEQIQQIFEAVYATFTVIPDGEITIEVNPGTVTPEKLKQYRRSGINRLSVGLQSVNDKELKMLGRAHTFADFTNTYQMARAEGLTNINIDLISAIPYQTEDSWKRTLRLTAQMEPEHISAYSLIIEEGTPFYDYYGGGRDNSELPSEETERAMYEQTKILLEQYGYNRYEISNYAREGYACRHNLGYWSRTEYLGIGSGAASLIDNTRFVAGEEPKKLSVHEQMEEFLFLGLRKTAGISIADFKNAFAVDIIQIYQPVIEKLVKNDLLKVQGDQIKLTERGIDISNYVMSEFLL